MSFQSTDSYTKTVLIIEDEATLRSMLAEEIEGKKVKILEAQNGKEGLEIALKEHPDLIVLDLLMPVMGGVEMLETLRKDEWGKTARVLILTQVENDLNKMADTMEQGVFEYMVKSRWTLEGITNRIKAKLDI